MPSNDLSLRRTNRVVNNIVTENKTVALSSYLRSFICVQLTLDALHVKSDLNYHKTFGVRLVLVLINITRDYKGLLIVYMRLFSIPFYFFFALSMNAIWRLIKL